MAQQHQQAVGRPDHQPGAMYGRHVLHLTAFLCQKYTFSSMPPRPLLCERVHIVMCWSWRKAAGCVHFQHAVTQVNVHAFMSGAPTLPGGDDPSSVSPTCTGWVRLFVHIHPLYTSARRRDKTAQQGIPLPACSRSGENALSPHTRTPTDTLLAPPGKLVATDHIPFALALW